MKFYFILFFIFFLGCYSYGQGPSKEYLEYINKADSFLYKNQYLEATLNYSKAFEINNGLGRIKDRYNAACCWATLNNKDSAFYQLSRISRVPTYSDYEKFESEEALTTLHNDIRWKTIIDKLKENKKNIEIMLQTEMQQ